MIPARWIFVAIVLLAPEVALAQQRGSDVGGQPARRKVTKYPKLVKFVDAPYPEAKRAEGSQGSVVLTIDIAASGVVTNVSVAATGGPEFDAAAIAAAKQFVFEPAEVDDKPAPSKITYRYDFVLTVVAPEKPAPAALDGQVHNTRNGRPVAGAVLTVKATDGETRTATTDAEGRFALGELPPGAYDVVVTFTDGTTARFSESLEAGKKTSARYDVELSHQRQDTPPLPEVEVHARPRARREVVQYSVRAEQARKVPGTQGDVLKVVQNLPGVSRPPVASGQIVVWGSAPNDTRVYVDGVEIPALYHGSGLRGTINSDLVSSIDLVPGAYGAEYGRGLGGLVRVETKALPHGTHGYAGADTLDGSAMVSTDLGSRARIAVAGRQSWLDTVLGWTSAPDIGDFFPIPRYRDGQVKATLDLRKNEALDAVFLVSHDDLARTVPSPDPAATRSQTTGDDFWRAYARYTNRSERGDTTILTPFVGHDSSDLLQRFGPVPAHLAIDTDRYGFRGLYRSTIEEHLSITLGLDALASSSTGVRQGSPTLPPREGDIAVFGQPPSDEYAADDWTTDIINIGPHAVADLRFGPVVLTPGIRYDGYLIEGNRKLPRSGTAPPSGFSHFEKATDLRASGRWEVVPRLAITAAYGTYHQAPEPADLSPVFGTPALSLSRATHITGGESLRITSTLSADVVAFQKTLRDLVVRSRLSNPLLARSLTQNGEGRSYGVQLLLRQELHKGFFGWISYAITKSERRNEGDPTWRAFDYDQPHVLSVVASQEIGRWTFGARFRVATGNPRTPVVASTYDARNDRYDPVFGAQNGIRIPAFWQLDARIERLFPLGETTRLLAYADVQNLTNRENSEEIVYSDDFRERGNIHGLPFIAIVGVRLEF